MTRYVLEFSNESNEAVTEVLKAAHDADGTFNVETRKDNIVIADAHLNTIGELAFLNFASEIISDFRKPGDLEGVALPEGSFHVRINSSSGKPEFSESEIGAVLRGNRNIDFRNPDFVTRAVFANGWYLGIVRYKKDLKGINSRRAPLRPFFSPVTIHPKFARFLLNLSRTRRGDTVLDPFCGTGGILLEAHLLGRRVIGSDASLNMVKGCRLNMKYFSAHAEIVHSDFMGLNMGEPVDGIVTDLPYGRSSELSNYSMDEMYENIFPRFHSFLKPHRYASLVLSDPDLLRHSEGLFRIVSSTAFRQHRSLTRYFISMRRI